MDHCPHKLAFLAAKTNKGGEVRALIFQAKPEVGS